MQQLLGMVVFVIGGLVIVALFTAYLVWFGRSKARQWAKRAERENAPKKIT